MAAPHFFPLQLPFAQSTLTVDSGHGLWFAQYGNPEGIPLIWLHGGPGSGMSVRHQCFVDPARYHLILFDQRGCGRSTPAGCLTDNTTAQLVQDIESLRQHLQLNTFLLGGGSWGATLALAYAAQYAHVLRGLILRASFLAGARDVTRFFQPDNPSAHDPWHRFAEHFPASERHDLLAALLPPMLADGRRARELAVAWRLYELQREQPSASEHDIKNDEIDNLLIRYRVQTHYLRHHCFVDEAALLHTAAQLPPLPVAILHGTEDSVCDPRNAHLLHARIPGSRLALIPGAGHDPFHPGMAAALLQALHCFAEDGHFAHWPEGTP